ncbi:MAG: sodium:proton antiporter [Desulfuromonadales bacterium]|jgi:NhaP-type Na+/H+ or K+/H+ antiporter
MHENALITLALILCAGIACQWLAWRLRLPAIIFLLGCGILAGPVLQWLQPDQLFGDLLFPFVSLSVAIILFEGSLTLRFKEIPGLAKVIRNMITFGVAVSWLITTLATRFLLDFSWEISCLFGAIMVVTGPTVIMPMIRTVRPSAGVANVLQWEGILIDPIGAVLAVLTYEFIVAGGLQGGLLTGVLVFAKIVLIGLAFGVGAGHIFATLVRKHWIPQYLHNVFALALVCGLFAASNLLEGESGLLSVTMMGLWLANRPDLELEDLLDFKESLSVLLISVLFIILAARMDLPGFLELGWPALGVFAVIQFLVRPLSVHVSALGSRLSMAERHLLAWIAPRGIVAAAISALFAIKLEAVGYLNAPQLVPLTFMVIIGTVVLQSATAGPIAKWLKVAEPEPKGFLIVGANLPARRIAKALTENGFKTLLADQNWSSVSSAKMQGLDAYWGNPVSEHAERHLNLIGIGHLLAISPHIELNALACQYYRLEFEPQRIYAIRNQPPDNGKPSDKAAFKFGGRPLFDNVITYQEFEKRLDQGAEIKKTKLTEEFTFEDYLARHREHRLLLFAIDDDQSAHVFTPEHEFTPEAGWSILALAMEDAAASAEANTAGDKT